MTTLMRATTGKPTEHLGTAAFPFEILQTGADAIAAGSVRDGARLVYKAAYEAVKEAAARHGAPCATDRDIQDFLYRMDGIPPLPEDGNIEPYVRRYREEMKNFRTEFLTNFTIACSFLEHADTPLETQLRNPDRYWNPQEYGARLNPVRELITKLATHNPPEVDQWTERSI